MDDLNKIAQAWVCPKCDTRSIGEGPIKCWICQGDMRQPTGPEWSAACGSWVHPWREKIIVGEEVWPLEWLWFCESCGTKVVSGTKPQCWPCRKYMRNPTLRELSEDSNY